MEQEKVLREISKEELKKHNADHTEQWVMVHGKIYDMTNYMNKHPGGKNLILRVTGKDATSDFEGMFHSQNARRILENYCIGRLEGLKINGMNGHLRPMRGLLAPYPNRGSIGRGSIGRGRGRAPMPMMNSKTMGKFDRTIISPDYWTKFMVEEIVRVNHNTKTFKFRLPRPNAKLPLPAGKHIEIKTKDSLVRKFTPIDVSEHGFFELIIKVYPNGKGSRFMFDLDVGEYVNMRGPFGDFTYKENQYDVIGLFGCGTGIAPLFQVIKEGLKNAIDKTKFILVYCNRSEEDILLKDKLDQLSAKHPDRFKIFYVLSKPKTLDHKYIGHISKELIATNVIPPKKKIPHRRDFFGLICGTSGFCDLVVKYLEDLDYNMSQMFIF